MTNRHIVTVLGLWVALFAGCAAEMADDPVTPDVEKTEAALTTLTPETFVAGYGGFTVTNVGGGTIQYRSFAKEFPGVRYPDGAI